MNQFASRCQDIRPLIFVGLEAALNREENRSLKSHLAVCRDCRDFERSERALSELLASDQLPTLAQQTKKPWVIGIPASLATIAAGLLAFLFLGPEQAQGLIIERSLGANLSWTAPNQSEVATSNHLSLSRQETVAISLSEGVNLDATGPARFELDRIDSRWKIVVLDGSIKVHTEQDHRLVVVNQSGRQVLTAGDHLLTPVSLQAITSVQDEGDAKSLIAAGQAAFGQASSSATTDEEKNQSRELLKKAESCFQAALKLKDLDDSQRNSALFYLFGSQGRLENYQEALKTAAIWIEAFPEDKSRSYVLYFKAEYEERLGNADRARTIREQIIAEDPQSELAELARRRLGIKVEAPATPKPTKVAPPTAITRSKPVAVAPAGPYLIIRVALDPSEAQDRGFITTAAKIQKFHAAEVADWDGQDLEQLQSILSQYQPENVLFVLQPETLDVNFHRHVLLASAKVDADIFPDFSFGYFTAKDSATLAKLWKRTEKIHRQGLSSKVWMNSSITSGTKSFSYDHPGSSAAREAGFTGKHFYLSISAKDPLDDARAVLKELETAAVIELTGNGDPQGIWLFDDHRNIDRSKHWAYDPKKVGNDPKGEMPRIMAQDFRALDLKSPIIWSGTCHSGATKRVYVEGDIVSTFGRADTVVAHELKDKNSLAQAWLDAGAVALLVPIAANHGVSVSMESTFALRHGASLGEAMKSTYDDVFLAANGDLVLDFVVAGENHPSREYVMQGGGANRILIGDPALRPFAKTAVQEDQLTLVSKTKGFHARVARKEGWASRGWDIYGRSSPSDWRIQARVDLKDYMTGDQSPAFDLLVNDCQTSTGVALPYLPTRCFSESYHGRRYLHLQANGLRKTVERLAVELSFELTEVP